LTFGNNGLVDLKKDLGRDTATIARIQSGTPGKVFENLLLLGSAGGENYLSAPGHLRAYNVITGKLEWIFYTIPQPGEHGYDTWPKDAYKYAGGVNTWGEISVDEKRGIAYFPLGSPTYDYYGADRLAAICMAIVCWRLMPGPGNVCGTSSLFTTTFGIMMPVPHHN
jgi:quinoprotein glucose dehydrogenase